MTVRAEVKGHRKLNKWFTPTHLDLGYPDEPERQTSSWTSRRSRKGRYQPKPHLIAHPSPTSTAGSKLEREVLMRVKMVESEIKPGLTMDITFWLAVVFTLGSAIWVVNGFLVWFPILRPNLATDTFVNTAAALAFVGGTVFEVGSYMMVIEALDRGRETSFGTALGQLLHHHRHVGPPPSLDSSYSSSEKTLQSSSSTGERPSDGAKRFIWWGKPMWHDMGYVAALAQLFGATIFWIATITGLPGVINGLYSETSSTAITDVFYWSPQVVGGTGFILSSTILMLEVQKKWWKPALFDLGWWIGFWNLVGAFGFTLCGALGYADIVSSGAAYQSALSTWWGSWAFLIGSVLQLYEAIWREQPASTADTGKV